MKILITGGAGYIGSHIAVQALSAGHQLVILDNLINSSQAAVKRVSEITSTCPVFIKGDIRDPDTLKTLFTEHSVDAVIHCAGLKSVGESKKKPLEYYDNNVGGTLILLEAMKKANIKKLIFSSSATVYGEEAPVPYIETLKRGTPSSPYGASKAMIEQILEDLTESDAEWSVVMLRYFNPIGAHPSGLIGEDPKGIPNNLMPFISQVAVGEREKLSIFGNNYTTTDGTCERDYLHVMDLAEGHIAALSALIAGGCHHYNLGTGRPVSVLQMVETFERTNKIHVPYDYAKRREGDLPAFWADASKAARELNWTAQHDLIDMVRDTWNWQKQNPTGYKME